MALGELRDHRKQAEDSMLVRAHCNFARVEVTDFANGVLCRVPQVEHLPSIVDEYPAFLGQRSIFRGAVEKFLAYFFFEPADCLTDRRLRPVQHIGRTRKALFLGYGHEYL